MESNETYYEIIQKIVLECDDVDKIKYWLNDNVLSRIYILNILASCLMNGREKTTIYIVHAFNIQKKEIMNIWTLQSGNQNLINNLISLYDIKCEYIKNKSLESVCKSKSIDMVVWTFTKFSITKDHIIKYDMISLACVYGTFEIFSFLRSFFDESEFTTHENIFEKFVSKITKNKPNNDLFFKFACIGKNVLIAQWLLKNCIIDNIYTKDVYLVVFVNNDVETMTMLIDFIKNDKFKKELVYNLFASACELNNLKMVQLFLNYVSTNEIINLFKILCNTYVINTGTFKIILHIVKIMLKKCEIQQLNLKCEIVNKNNLYDLMMTSCKNNKYNVLFTISKIFNLTMDYLVYDNYNLFKHACSSNNLKIATCFPILLNMSRKEILCDDNYIFKWACNYGHINIVKWLLFDYCLTKEEIMKDNNCALQWACENSHSEITQLLVYYCHNL